MGLNTGLAHCVWPVFCTLGRRMPLYCPKCQNLGKTSSGFVRFGLFFRSSDCQRIQRFRCRTCNATCSNATFHAWFRQKKRNKNYALWVHFSSCGSLRRAARTFHLNRKTVARKLICLGFHSETLLLEANLKKPKCSIVEFDDLETFEHTKCKPLSVTLAVESGTRRILGAEVSSMPANGHLAERSREKYGRRRDRRKKAREKLFSQIQCLVHSDAIFKSDEHPHYPSSVKKYFPQAKHVFYKSRRAASSGQGELKKGGFDPLFSLNHTCAMLRANINRLIRKTWCTTKRADRLRAHLMIYAHYHNLNLT